MDRRIVEMYGETELEGLEEHTAESKWQYCNCKTCRNKRRKLERMPPGTPINWDKIRLKDERY